MPDETPQNDQKWLVVFLVYADFTVQKASNVVVDNEVKIGLDAMLKDIITMPINPEKTRVFVLMNILVFCKESGKRVERIFRYELIGDYFNNTINFEPVSSRNKVDEPHGLGNIFKTITPAADEEIFLITWDHGSAFGIFQDELKIAEPYNLNLYEYPYLRMFLDVAERYTSNRVFTNKGIKGRVFKEKDVIYHYHRSEVLDDLSSIEINQAIARKDISIGDKSKINEQKSDILRNDELATAIDFWLKKTAPQKKIGVLMMMNCYMMNFHTMYSLKGAVNCLVAPQGTMTNPGYNYRAILKYLNTAVNSTPQKLAKECVELSCGNDAWERAKSMILGEDDTIDIWTLLAIDLQKKVELEYARNWVKEIKLKKLYIKDLWDNLVVDLINKIELADKKELGENTTKVKSNKNERKSFIDFNQIDFQLITLKYFLQSIIKHYNHTYIPINNITDTPINNIFEFGRSIVYDFSINYCMIDIVNWCDIIKKIDGSFEDAQLSLELLAYLGGFCDSITYEANTPIIIWQKNAKRYYKMEDNRYIMPRPIGCSLFFPQNNRNFAVNDSLRNHLKYDPLLNNYLSDWKNFIEIYCHL